MDVIDQITAEVARATMKFPTWPTDPLHALADSARNTAS